MERSLFIPEFSDRQRVYGELFGLGSVYTPQMVVDGQFEFVGSDERQAIRAVEEAPKVQKVPLVLSSIRREANNAIVLHVEAGPLRSHSAQSAKVLIAIADDSNESRVTNGENAKNSEARCGREEHSASRNCGWGQWIFPGRDGQ